MDKARELLRDCSDALLAWTLTYAPECCSREERVAAVRRIDGNGGTLAYIARLRERIEAYLAASAAEPCCRLCSIDDSLVQEWVAKARAVAKSKGLLAAPAAEPVASGDFWQRMYGQPFAELVAAPQPEAPTLADDAVSAGLKADAQAIKVIGMGREQLLRQVEFDAARIRALEADIENAVWNLGGCDCFANGWAKPDDPIDESAARPALLSVRKMAAELAASRERERALRDVIAWALGEGDDFPDWPESVTIKGNPKYWWRKELRARYDRALATPDSAASPTGGEG